MKSVITTAIRVKRLVITDHNPEKGKGQIALVGMASEALKEHQKGASRMAFRCKRKTSKSKKAVHKMRRMQTS